MPLFHIVILALVQGITEFLPISSSGHLVLAHALLGSDGYMQDMTMDIAVHVGTLGAVLIYFRKDICGMLCCLCCKTKNSATDKKMMWHVLLASLPVIAAGFLFHVFQPEWVRSLLLLGMMSVIFGIVLWCADKFKPVDRTLETLNWKGALFVGMAQILSLLPGTSRSGITMTAARWLGFSRTESARFSLLLAVVAISGAGTLGGFDLLQSGDVELGLDALLAALISFVASWVAIIFMMKWLEHSTFTPFVIYRVALGVLILALYYGGMLI